MSDEASKGSIARAGRPRERDSLYNPAFMALLLSRAAREHEKRAGQGMPFALAFLVAPIVLHQATREALPNQARSKMALWLDDHPVFRAGLGRRATNLAPAVRAGVRYGLRSGVLILDAGTIRGVNTSSKGNAGPLSSEVEAILKRAGFVGGWFALSGPAAGIYALWRVTP